MGSTLFDKVWDNHVVKRISDDVHVLYIDQHFIHEVTSPQAFNGIRKRGISFFRPNRTLATADHNVPTDNHFAPIKDEASRTQVEALNKNCEEFNIEYFGMGDENQGIVHVIGPELGKTIPGSTIVCGDSHTSTHGAFGTIAFGIGTSQVEQVFASQCLVLTKPKVMRITLENEVGFGVSAKDIILYIISNLGMEGATGYFVEYAGAAIENLSMEERMTITNMSIEMGARGGMIGIDKKTIAYMNARKEISEDTIQKWLSLNTDQDAAFDKEIVLDASLIRPMATVGTSPDTGIYIENQVKSAQHGSQKGREYMGFEEEDFISNRKIDYVFIGSCTNGRIEDLRAAASVLKDRKKAENVIGWVVPGSRKVKLQAIEEGLDQIFVKAGLEFREPGCSACLAMNDDKIPKGAVCVSTSNRNFEGRQGEGALTILASPITAAASALEGKVADPRPYILKN